MLTSPPPLKLLHNAISIRASIVVVIYTLCRMGSCSIAWACTVVYGHISSQQFEWKPVLRKHWTAWNSSRQRRPEQCRCYPPCAQRLFCRLLRSVSLEQTSSNSQRPKIITHDLLNFRASGKFDVFQPISTSYRGPKSPFFCNILMGKT